MQTLSVQIKDSYIQDFMKYVKTHSDKITITKDMNLEYDPYFYERKKELEHVVAECENGNMEILSEEKYDKEMEIFFKNLKADASL